MHISYNLVNHCPLVGHSEHFQYCKQFYFSFQRQSLTLGSSWPGAHCVAQADLGLPAVFLTQTLSAGVTGLAMYCGGQRTTLNRVPQILSTIFLCLAGFLTSLELRGGAGKSLITNEPQGPALPFPPGWCSGLCPMFCWFVVVFCLSVLHGIWRLHLISLCLQSKHFPDKPSPRGIRSS